MKILITILAFLNGGYMLIDGIFVLLKGKYIGPQKPGPWARIFDALQMNVYNMGPLFIVFGLFWLIWIWALWSQQKWANLYGVVISILTLWYLPVGTLFSLIILGVLLFAKHQLGLG